MPQVKPEIETFARIKVIGSGGSGGNAINHMINQKVKGVEFIAVNTDAQALHTSQAKKKIHIGKNLTKGLGTGMNPDLGRKAVEETKEEIQEAVKGADMVFIASGLGGGTGSGSSPTIAQIAKEAGVLTVAVVTKPFFFEGQNRMRIAEKAADELSKEVDALIVIPNDRLLQVVSEDTTAKNAFAMCDDVLKSAVEGISDLITKPGIINIDFADIRAILTDAGAALMGIGLASGENRAEVAAKQAIESPLLDVSMNGARGVLFSIAGGDDVTMHEIQQAAQVITESMDPDARVIFGTIKDESLKKGDIKITIIASGFTGQSSKKTLFGSSDNGKEEKGKIFNSMTEPKEKEEAQDTKKKAKEDKKVADISTKEDIKKKVNEEDDDDEWGAVPAFLRRSKIK